MQKKATLSVSAEDLGKWVVILVVLGALCWLVWRWLLGLTAKAKTSLDILAINLNSENVTPEFANSVRERAAEANELFVKSGFFNTFFDDENIYSKRKTFATKLYAASDDELKLFVSVYNTTYTDESFFQALSENKGGLEDATTGMIDKLLSRLELLKLK